MIKYVKGDATRPFHPVGSEVKIIPHVCNDVGKWGAGFVRALSARCKEPEKAYRRWYADSDRYEDIPFRLGYTQLVPFCGEHSGLYVCNMIAQSGVGGTKFNVNGKFAFIPPIRYDSLKICLFRLAEHAHTFSPAASIHAPKFGAGLAGGDWPTIQGMITQILVGFGGLDVTIYEIDV